MQFNENISIRFLSLFANCCDKRLTGIIFWALAMTINFSCKKFIQIPEPLNTITSPEVFSSDANATSAVTAIYSNMIHGGQRFASSGTTIYAGLSADEITTPNSGGILFQFQSNAILSNNPYPGAYFWTPAYYDIYMANGVIEGLQNSTTISRETKNQLMGEAKFLRAFCYFYLTNFFGDVPLVLSTNWNQTEILPKTPAIEVYGQIEQDLLDAQNLLADDYSVSASERIRANKWAAIALLARVRLYQPQPNWTGADSASTAIINESSLFGLDTLNGIFLNNSQETILQLQGINTSPWATYEGFYFIPPSATSSPSFYLTNQMLLSFEAGDHRRSSWTDSSIYRGKTYYYPYKYKTRMATSGTDSGYYTLLRLAEQYLIRAEARTNESPNNLVGAIDDINAIRNRAGLDSLAYSLTQTQVIAALEQERRIELFAEWGHRWFDLKRWGTAVSTLSTISYKLGHINASQLLYPIPPAEIQTDPRLIQNPGY